MDRNQLERRLREIREPAPRPELQARLEQGIPDSLRRPESRRIPGRLVMVTRLATVAAALAGIVWLGFALVFGPASTPTYAAMLEPVLQATDRAGAVHVVLRVLAAEGEDFSFVNLDGDLTEVEAWIEMPRSPGQAARARIDKPDRIRCFDGKEIVEYHPNDNEAYRAAEGGPIDVDLFWPAAWVRYLLSIPGSDVEIVSREESGGLGRVVLRQKGVPTAPREPAFLGEFDRETEVEWDLDTDLLRGLRRFVRVGGERRLFSESVSIEYVPSIDDAVFRVELPEDVRWAGVKEAPAELLALGPREVANELFEAARKGDRATLEMLCPSPATVDFLLEERHRPQALLFLGDPFRAGEYAGVYVPYRVRLARGVKQHNLALRNDNPERRWVYDGGI